jgi:transcription elongation GreA/GreB family factor
MSRAFVKEDTDAPPDIPERPISAAPNRVTPTGAALIQQEVARLQQRLAADPGPDTAATLRRDLRYWLSRQATMQIVPPNPAPAEAGFGTTVTIRRGRTSRTITIVGEDEAEPAEGRIAWTAPLARALEGAVVGDEVELDAGGRREPIRVLKIEAR